MIVLKPVGGLCNRIRAISTFIDLCQELDIDIQICWKKNTELNADFNDLFNPIQLRDIKVEFIINGRDGLKFSDRQMNFPRQRIYNTLLKVYQRLYFDQVFHTTDTLKLIAENYDFRQLKHYKNPYLSTWNRISQNPVRPGLFKPKDHLLNLIDFEAQKFGNSTIGVHIRRADHLQSIKESPLELFVQKMKEDIQKHDDTNFFIASDSTEVKAKLKATFGERILVQNEKNADRQSSEGMEEAIVDLFALAKTQKIYGSSNSSFGITASEFNNIPYQEIKL